jgi:hypothetical protein
MTQQPNQNQPQPGQWGQPQPAPPQQQPQPPNQGWAQPAQQWGAPQQGYPQQQQWGAPAVGGAAASVIAKAWAVWTAVGLAAVAGVSAFLAYLSVDLEPPGSEKITTTISATGQASASGGGQSRSGTAQGYTAAWGWLLVAV